MLEDDEHTSVEYVINSFCQITVDGNTSNILVYMMKYMK